MRDFFEPRSATEPKALRPYQADAIARVRQSLARGNRRVVLALPTGGGKTLIAAHIVRGALGKGGRACFTAPMVTLIDQTIAAFEAEGLDDIGAMQADHPRTRWGAAVQVASVQTLARRARPRCSVVLVDECHVYSQAVIDWMAEPDAPVFIGLSATPGRAGMAAEWDDLVVGVTTQQLIDEGYLSRFAVYAPSTADLSGVKVRAGEYVTADAEAAMGDKKLVGDILQNWLLHGEGRPTLGFAVSVAHAHRMAEDFEAAGISSAAVDASTDSLERRAIQDAFRRGEIKVIWSVRTMTTGVDLPVSGIIDAAPTQSPMLHQQKIGRGLRVNPGTEDLVVWDHAGNTLRLGFVTDLDWSTLPDGVRGDAAERKPPLPKECTECHNLMPPKVKVCPDCGAERKAPSGFVETEDGDLVPLTPEPEKRETPKHVKQAWYSGLIGIAQQRGYKRGWAANKYRERFGVWPRGLMEIGTEPTPEMRSWVKSRAIAFAKARQKGADNHAT